MKTMSTRPYPSLGNVQPGPRWKYSIIAERNYCWHCRFHLQVVNRIRQREFRSHPTLSFSDSIYQLSSCFGFKTNLQSIPNKCATLNHWHLKNWIGIGKLKCLCKWKRKKHGDFCFSEYLKYLQHFAHCIEQSSNYITILWIVLLFWLIAKIGRKN